MALPGVISTPRRAGYDVVIVGAGIQGLATAYELAKLGHTDVLVLDRSWPGSGASGRNGELIRSAFASPEWCDLFELARLKWLGLSEELDHNVLFNRTGYAVLASTEKQWKTCVADATFQNSRGIKSELLDERAARELLPAANPEMVRGAVFQTGAGFAHHDACVGGYLENAARMGVDIVCNEEVVAIERKSGIVTGVRTASGQTIGARIVLNAAGGDAPDLDDLAGVASSLVSARLEMIVTQPVRPFLRPGLAALNLLGYCHQTGRGEFVGGTERHGVDETKSLNGSLEMLKDMATKFVGLFPLLAGVNLLRHWAGTVSQTPDLAPILGPVPDLEGYLLSTGWVYGFMGAPAAGELLAKYITTGVVDKRMTPFGIQRVLEGKWIREGSLVVDMGY
jgi:sarcosine oxidase subunit beta